MGKPELPEITVIIVSYESARFLPRCIDSVPGSSPVIVVDNASSDDSLTVLESVSREITIVRSPVNLGLSKAVNLALERCRTPWALLLNPDTQMRLGALETMAALADSENVIAVAPRLQLPDGSLQLSTAKHLSLWAVFCEQFLLEPFLRRSPRWAPYWNTQFLAGPAKVEQAMGACLLVPSRVRLDGRFFLYCEDSDLCKRMGEHGEIWYQPEAVVEHELGASSEHARWQAVALYNSGKELYFRIHHGRFASFFCLICNRKGALLRVILALPLMAFSPRRGLRRLSTFWRVLWAPLNLQKKRLCKVEESLREARQR